MRGIAEAEKHWRQLDDFHSLTDLKIAVSSHREPQITAGLRSVCWKIFLLLKTLDRSSWPARISESRTTYASLRSHYLNAIEHPDELGSSVDPLSENEESPWVALRSDEALRAEIFQDIERCMPDNVYFRQPATQNMMLDVLFVWCKMHPNVGYRQGMHEILAPLLWVIERDAVDMARVDTAEVEQTLVDMLDASYMEHDTFTLFSLIMQTAMSFYVPADPASNFKESPMLARCARIFERYLPKTDPELASHLVKLEIVPQIFLLRWIRLLYGREFPLDDVLNVWDALFAIDSTLELVDMISIAMLLRIRWDLIAADTNEAFTLLLRYPEPDAPAYTFIKDALYLRDHLTPEGGAEIITRYGKRAPAIDTNRPPPALRLPSPAPSSASHRTRNSTGSPTAFVSQQGAGLEALLQGAAKNVIERGSQWGVGKAIRDAVGEVRKHAEAIQSGVPTAPPSGQTTPRSGGREYRKPAQLPGVSSRPAIPRVQSGNALKKIESLERRSKDLAKMLEAAVAELWDYHKERSEEDKEPDQAKKDAIEVLSLAIAKVQFVQVYLEDSSIPLPVEEMTEQAATANAAASLLSPIPTPPTVPERTTSAPPVPNSLQQNSPASSSQPTSPAADASPLARSHVQIQPISSRLPPRARPTLASSNFSWMLGQDSGSTASAFASSTAHSAFASDEKRRLKGKGFLFGDEDEAEEPANEKKGSTYGKGGAKNGKSKSKALTEADVEEEVIDLRDVGKRDAVM
ncbi:RabGAP/TBC [Bimuria novae-zelandiae CBS 107.79]|uniref:RabGAP/TBC n=1 Tax=Bimuria novae-zelandiae CBS 107.79 TaxID=1447943 RepID=A0A6A5VF93_9PLEO|nr:RabGAP/TBC [Bimuria novae-zelandiae CBS 107.79]